MRAQLGDDYRPQCTSNSRVYWPHHQGEWTMYNTTEAASTTFENYVKNKTQQSLYSGSFKISQMGRRLRHLQRWEGWGANLLFGK